MRELDKEMYFKAQPGIIENAILLRKNMTHAENLLWEKFNKKQLLGLRFRRQPPIDMFIVDFYCHKARLVIELDGPIHDDQVEYDDGREAEIEKYNLKVLRFKNDEVIDNIEKVLTKIEEIIKQRI